MTRQNTSCVRFMGFKVDSEFIFPCKESWKGKLETFAQWWDRLNHHNTAPLA